MRFKAKVVDPSGGKIEIELFEEDKKSAIYCLRKQGYLIIELVEQTEVLELKDAESERRKENTGCLWFIAAIMVIYMTTCSLTDSRKETNIDDIIDNKKFDGKTIEQLHREGRYRGYNDTDDIERDLKNINEAVKIIKKRGY
jgi:bifunctional N-acetylglucosamine-1-phosphate-uridyltransferase/glucosamine-1-phosphate-acetyltransferase GlmU-like protein